MPIVEIDDQYAAELAKLSIPTRDLTQAARSAAEFEKMHREIANGPNRLELLRLLKKQYPTLVVPEIDAAAPLNADIEALRKEFNDYRENIEKERKEREEEDRKSSATKTVADGRKWLREQGCDDEGVAAVEKIMQDANLANYEIAFSHFARNQPKPETLPSTSFMGNSLDWFKAEDDAPDHKLLLDNPVGFKNAEVAKFFRQKAEGRLNLGTQ